MRPSFEPFGASLPDEDQVEIRRTVWTYRGLGLGIPLAAFVWGFSRHGLLATVDLFLHPATLFAAGAFYMLVPMVFGLMFSGATAVDYWRRRAEGEADTDGH